jgi:hypothetical protein
MRLLFVLFVFSLFLLLSQPIQPAPEDSTNKKSILAESYLSVNYLEQKEVKFSAILNNDNIGLRIWKANSEFEKIKIKRCGVIAKKCRQTVDKPP